jgi:hypothetical protein
MTALPEPRHPFLSHRATTSTTLCTQKPKIEKQCQDLKEWVKMLLIT